MSNLSLFSFIFFSTILSYANSRYLLHFDHFAPEHEPLGLEDLKGSGAEISSQLDEYVPDNPSERFRRTEEQPSFSSENTLDQDSGSSGLYDDQWRLGKRDQPQPQNLYRVLRMGKRSVPTQDMSSDDIEGEMIQPEKRFDDLMRMGKRYLSFGDDVIRMGKRSGSMDGMMRMGKRFSGDIMRMGKRFGYDDRMGKRFDALRMGKRLSALRMGKRYLGDYVMRMGKRSTAFQDSGLMRMGKRSGGDNKKDQIGDDMIRMGKRYLGGDVMRMGKRDQQAFNFMSRMGRSAADADDAEEISRAVINDAVLRMEKRTLEDLGEVLRMGKRSGSDIPDDMDYLDDPDPMTTDKKAYPDDMMRMGKKSSAFNDDFALRMGKKSPSGSFDIDLMRMGKRESSLSKDNMTAWKRKLATSFLRMG